MIGARGLLITCLAFLLVGAAIHLNGSPASLLSDDFVILEAVDHGGAFGMWTDSSRAFLRPLVSLLMWTEYQVWHLDPMGYRVVSVLLHSLASILVVMIGLAIMTAHGAGGRRASYLAVPAGLLFLTSACHSEPVSWTSCQTDLLATCFALLALWSYIRGRAAHSTRPLVASVALFACGLLSKESTAVLPLLLICYEAFDWKAAASSRGPRIRGLVRVVPYFVTLALYIGLRYLVLGTAVGGYGGPTGLKARAARVVIGLVSLPTRTCLPPLPTRITAVSLFAVLLLAVLVATYIAWKRKQAPFPRTIPLLLGLYLVSLLPVVSIPISKTLTEGERLVYFPSAFGMLLLVAVLDFIISKIRVVTAVVAGLALVSGLLLFRAECNWRAAAGIARGVKDSLESMEGGGRLVVLNLPDNLKGAYVFRNGFRAMLSFSALNHKWNEVVILATTTLVTPSDSVRIEKHGGLIHVSQSGSKAHFRKPNRLLQNGLDPGRYRIIEFAPEAYTFESNPAGSDSSVDPIRLVYYARGRLARPPIR